MIKRVFIIHGWESNPDEAWLGWLRKELERRGIETVAPQMPNTDEPKIEEWVPFLTKLVGESSEEYIFVGHSIGCQAILRYLESVFPKKVSKVIFVAGWFNLNNLEDEESKNIARPWVETPIDFEKVKKVASDIQVFLSDNDPWVPLSNKEIFEQKLGAKVVVMSKGGHINKDDGTLELPEVLNEIIK